MKINADTLKFIGGAIVVLAAALIMLPGFFSVALGLGRILLVIAIAGGACLLLAYTVHFLKRKRNPSDNPTSAPPTDVTPN